MPKFAELSTYAGAIAPVIGAVHVNVHAADRAVGRELSGAPDPSPGFLNDLRFTLPLRPLTRAALAAVYRYGTADERESIIQEHLEQGTLTEDPDGLLHATDHGLEIIHSLYGLHAAAVERIWPDHDVPALATLARSVLTRAQQDLSATAHPSGHSAEAVAVRSRWWCRRTSRWTPRQGCCCSTGSPPCATTARTRTPRPGRKRACRWPTSSP